MERRADRTIVAVSESARRRCAPDRNDPPYAIRRAQRRPPGAERHRRYQHQVNRKRHDRHQDRRGDDVAVPVQGDALAVD